MATTEELMAALNDTIPEHTHNVSDSDTYFIIDPITRQVTNTAAAKNVLMQYDHRSEVFTFEIPRYVEGHDMMLCTAVKIHFSNIDSETEQENTGVVDADDLMIDPLNNNNVICNWEIARDCTQLAGILSFIIQYVCVDDDGNVIYEWHSDIYYDIEVRPGRNYDESEIREYTSILEQWRLQLFGEGDSAVTRINETFETKKSELLAESQTQQDEIDAKGAEVLATIPENYTETHNMADEALRKKANAVILSETGSSHIFLDDSSDCNLIGLNLYGRTTQVSTTGKNILNLPDVPGVSKNNITYKCTGGVWACRGYPSSHYTVLYALTDITDILEDGQTYTLSQTVTFDNYQSSGSIYAQLDANRSDGTYTRWMSVDGAKTFTVDKTEYSSYTVVIMTGGSNGKITIDELMFQLEEGTAQTAWEPYSGNVASPSPEWIQPLNSITEPNVVLTGKNLFNINATKSSGNATTSVEGNTLVVLQNNSNTWTSANFRLRELENSIGETISFRCEAKSSSTNMASARIQWVRSNGSAVTFGDDYLVVSSESTEFTEMKFTAKVPRRPHNGAYLALMLYSNAATPSLPADTTYQCFYKDIQLVFGSEPGTIMPYQPLQEISVARTLRGVPVSQNGNYTDSNGQQWICDEIDYERGKFIQRVQELVLDETREFHFNTDNNFFQTVDNCAKNSAKWESRVLSNHFIPIGNGIGINDYNWIQLDAGSDVRFKMKDITTVDALKLWIADNNITVIYPLKTPVETDLTAAELQAFRALRTNATNTTIINDKNAMMDVKYVADLKRYIYKNVTIKEDEFDLVLREANWVSSSDGRYYTQLIDYQPRHNGKITLCPTAAQQISLILDGIAMFVANENGVATAYCISSTPGRDITIKATEQVVVFV